VVAPRLTITSDPVNLAETRRWQTRGITTPVWCRTPTRCLALPNLTSANQYGYG